MPVAPNPSPAQSRRISLDPRTQAAEPAELGLAHWMPRVLRARKRAIKELNAEDVHDLRTALRRCLSIADAMEEFDPHPNWRRMKRAGKTLLKHLGPLRDSQVLLEWLKKPEIPQDPLGTALKASIEQEQFKAEALHALKDFDPRKWKSWESALTARTASISPASLAWPYVALETWEEAYRRHRFALRSRSKIGYHRLRVGLKNFRYTVENFLPGLQAKWGAGLKQFQNLLGEVHDLDVLWSRVIRLKPPCSRATLMDWKAAIEYEKNERLSQYTLRAAGKNSLWRAWRAALPQNENLEEAVVAKFAAWSSFRTPDFARVQRIAALALQLYDALAARGFAVGLPTERARWIVQAAALMQDAGRSAGNRGHHKESYRLIRKQPLPIRWKPAELQLAALVARYHRKALPQPKHEEFSALPSPMRQATFLLAGILRLANGFAQAAKPIRKLDVSVTLDGLTIRAYGYDGEEPLLSKLAHAKHLLEIACRRPIVVLPGVPGAPRHAVESKAATHAA